MKLAKLTFAALLLATTSLQAMTWEDVKLYLESKEQGYTVQEIVLVGDTIKVEATKDGVKYEFVFDGTVAEPSDPLALLSSEIDGSDDDDSDDDSEDDDDDEDDDEDDDDDHEDDKDQEGD